uniref:Prefoldin subunit 1 n=1 Tax=Chromera velia CCMP2878 TaxID=1169474 RepID=A0A0G4F7P0_9ALVE|mmetsp:Transcript_24109/g.47337  ORF Transcript_24109/g.47337 Transcript_24109/m.47337 type:complete len:136 (+) Transcript_24109:225-632(+)|eukprot:Cvel_2911.t1-p1 / transcript=Cvel_2911.t1 / gene=Cvel_2911 / organism=Chromera_velia_CCMP2878 / gene_product=Prefoldin subunit beta, putative / transcript_product=Prefoldin subunit beta, putative / location=Cvel_scaffold115:63529-64045(-) / protein_length=135 / sequence_SO=supercontig / SO=protein_coding / is_pseudo=false
MTKEKKKKRDQKKQQGEGKDQILVPEELQCRMRSLESDLKMVGVQQKQLEANIRKSILSIKEIQSLDENVPLLRSVGRMYMFQGRQEILKGLENEKERMQKRENQKLTAQECILKIQMKELTDEIREAIRQQARG